MGLIAFTSITIAYSAVAVGANNLILTWYTMSAQNLLNARTTTAAVLAQKENGVNYWRTWLVSYSGMGGIQVDTPINENDAIIISENNFMKNVLAADFSLAG